MAVWWVVVVTGEKMITIWEVEGEGRSKRRRWARWAGGGQGGRADVWHGKRLEADNHSMDLLFKVVVMVMMLCGRDDDERGNEETG